MSIVERYYVATEPRASEAVKQSQHAGQTALIFSLPAMNFPGGRALWGRLKTCAPVGNRRFRTRLTARFLQQFWLRLCCSVGQVICLPPPFRRCLGCGDVAQCCRRFRLPRPFAGVFFTASQRAVAGSGDSGSDDARATFPARASPIETWFVSSVAPSVWFSATRAVL
jgi:hypothetical protein